MPEKRVTLQDIVEKTGFSRATVSLALRGLGTLSDDTRQTIRKAAEQMGYQPDPLLSAFSRHRQKGASPGSVIALIGRADLKGWLEPVVPLANRLGYRLEAFDWEDYPSQTNLVRILEARGVAGAIFLEGRSLPVPDLTLWRRLRCVQCGPYPSGDDSHCPFPIVRSNPFDAMSIAWQKAVAAGRGRVGFVLASKQAVLENIEAKMLAAYVFYQQETAETAQLAPLRMTIEESLGQGGIQLTRQWLADQRPDVVIVSALRGYELLLKSGCRIPDDSQVINLRQSGSRHDTAGLVLDRVEVVKSAIHQLHMIIQHGAEMLTEHRTTIVLNPLWQDGDSFPVSSECPSQRQ